MARVVGIDPGTVSIDICGMDDGRIYLDRSWPTEEALAHPAEFIELLTATGRPELVAGPSGYGLPMVRGPDATDADLRLAFLAPPNEPGGLGGLSRLARQLGSSDLPVIYTPGVIHLDTVPTHRKINRVDMGTADKLCAGVLGIYDQCARRGLPPSEVSFILAELGGGFTSALAIEKGQVVDGVGGTSGPIGWRSAGALDGEVAFLAGLISKAALFQGGVASLVAKNPDLASVGLNAYIEGVEKAIRQLRCSAPSADEILLSGRHAAEERIREPLSTRLKDIGPVRLLSGAASVAKQGAEGAALLANGLAGGASRELVERLRIKQASGTVLDHLVFVSPADARNRLGIANG
jgi:predicted butyrate kinase (DUF1464 family)